MKMVIGILLALYFFGIVPFLAGVFWDTVTGAKEHRLVRAYVNGYVAMFAAFWCVAFVFLYRGCTLKRLCLVWLVASAVICIISVLVGRKNLLAYGRHAVNIVQKSDRLMRIAMLLSVVLLLLSVAVFKPRVEATVETVATAVATDSTYIYQPYTGEQFPATQTEKIQSPYEMLYAPMVQFSGGKAAFLIKIILPFFLIPFFYGVCAELGRELFFEQRKQAVFLLIVEALYTAPVYTAVGTSVAGIFQNCWNGDVLLNCCVLPFAFLQILKLADVLQHGTAECRQREKIDHPGIHVAGMLLLSYPAAQLCAKKGWFFILLMTILLVVVLVVRKGVSMSALWTDIRNAYFSYNGMGVNLFFLFVAVVYLLVTEKKRQRNLLIYEIFGILFLVTPVLANAIIERAGNGTGNWKVYGILNAAVLVAFVATDFFMDRESRRERVGTLVVFFLLIQAGMSLNYSTDYLGFVSNPYKISSEAEEIAGEIAFLEEPRVFAPAEIASGLRQYDTKYAVIYGDGLSYSPQDQAQFTQEITAYGCNCVVVATEYDDVDFFNGLGFSRISSTRHYEVYAK